MSNNMSPALTSTLIPKCFVFPSHEPASFTNHIFPLTASKLPHRGQSMMLGWISGPCKFSLTVDSNEPPYHNVLGCIRSMHFFDPNFVFFCFVRSPVNLGKCGRDLKLRCGSKPSTNVDISQLQVTHLFAICYSINCNVKKENILDNLDKQDFFFFFFYFSETKGLQPKDNRSFTSPWRITVSLDIQHFGEHTAN